MGHGLRVSFKIEKCRWPATAKLDEMVHMLGMGMVPGYTAFFFFFFNRYFIIMLRRIECT